TPRVSEPLVRRISSTRVAFAPWLDTQGPYQALLWDALTERDRFEDAREETRAHLVAEAAGRARAAFAATAGGADAGGVWTSEGQAALMGDYAADRHSAPAAAAAAGRRANAAGTSFVVVDDRGAAVACGLTMGRPFGAGRVAGDTGIIPAVRSDASIDDDSLAPIRAMNPNSNVPLLAAAGSGPGAAAAGTAGARRTLEAGQALESAMDPPRAEHRGAPDVTFVEPAAPDAMREDLAARGHVVQRLPSPSLVNAAFCSGGMPRSPGSCRIGTDRRGFGLDAFVRR